MGYPVRAAASVQLTAVDFTVGENVEVWSNSRENWLPAVVQGVYLAATTTEGFDVPPGSVKVISSAGVKWVMADSISSVLRKASAEGLATMSKLGAAGGAPSSSTRKLCKNGCGRLVQPGLTRGLKPYDTCCKRCAQKPGANEHDENCGGANVTRAVQCFDVLRSLRDELEAILHDKMVLEQTVRTAFQRVSVPFERLSWQQLRAPLEELLEPFGVRLGVKDHFLEHLCQQHGQPEDRTIDTDGILALSRTVLEDRYRSWFPEILPVSTASFVKQNKRPLEEVYAIGKKLGEGSFGTVYEVDHKLSGERRVCKKIWKTKSDMTSQQILQEIGNMAMLDHPNVIKVFEYFDEPNFVSQIMEPCYGGELQDKVAAFRKTGKAPYDEAFVCDVMKQTLRALAFMHKKPFLHKDLKPQNIMLVDQDSSSIKVIDFGLAELFNPMQKFANFIGGTRLYMAPEVFRQQMTVKTDIWSAGVILYNLLTGDFPFLAQWPPPKGKDEAWWEEQTIQKIKHEAPVRHPLLSKWSACCNDLLMRMLDKDDASRPDAAQCLEHPWFSAYSEVPPTLSVGVLQCVESYARMPELRKGIFLLLAHQYEVQKTALVELRSLFTHFDVRNQGSLSAQDLKAVLVKSGMGGVAAERVCHALDHRRDGQITWTEFTAAAMWYVVCRNNRAIDAAFATFDVDQDGRITARDLQSVLADEKGREAWHKHMPALFEDIEKQEITSIQRTARNAIRSFMHVLKKEAMRYANLDQFRQYLQQNMDFRAGDALYAVS
ncbi:CPK7 [Symbiodinium necroappetens]|uniref:non-specific serine/threonine protein kinase n=1 Tax=Symbiodinium necroappetens TaxID=1628268 RepID=A0A812WLK2_9DINO|nr:CPK7 [Symbiodinium necroappetens]